MDARQSVASGAAGDGRLVVVRHGATAWSIAGRHTGRTDLPLEPVGCDEAVALGPRLAGHRFGLVLTSPLERARETCVLAGFGDVAQVCPDLAEWDYGEYEGRTTAEIRAERPGWDLWRDGAPGGECVGEVGARADRVVTLSCGTPGDVLAFAHAHLLRVLAARWLGLDPTVGRYLVLSPATISVLGWERDTAVVERWNDARGDLVARDG